MFTVKTPIGRLFLYEDARGGALSRVDREGFAAEDEEFAKTPFLKGAARQIEEYFDGKRKKFDIPLSLKGTPFQVAVWNALCAIPYGETRTYAELASAVGRPNAYRAAGSANGKNPMAVVVPCHRVIAAGGKIGGFGWGLEIKRVLLDLERGFSEK